jgi:hypothetical protein
VFASVSYLLLCYFLPFAFPWGYYLQRADVRNSGQATGATYLICFEAEEQIPSCNQCAKTKNAGAVSKYWQVSAGRHKVGVQVESQCSRKRGIAGSSGQYGHGHLRGRE